jgi:hypothetical protein
MSTSLRLAAASLALLLPLSACGDETAPRAEEEAGASSSAEPSDTPSASPSGSPSAPSGAPGQSGPLPVTGDAGVERAVVVAGSEVGGQVSPLAFPLETRQERRDFGAVFQRGFGRKVAQAAREVDAPGTTTWGTVAAVGCAAPSSVRIDAGEAGFQVAPRMPKNTVQCLVPVTYVVVFAAPAAG